MARHPKGHLYRGGKRHRAAMQAKFTKRYGRKGKYVYGAVVGAAYRKSHHGRNWNQRR
jgi:hypothetical protein